MSPRSCRACTRCTRSTPSATSSRPSRAGRGARYANEGAEQKALRVLADHGRAMTMLATDGVLPSNESRGYILRRIIRRAVQHGSRIGLESPFLGRLQDLVIEQLGAFHPALVEHRDDVRRLLEAEEQRFAATLQTGSALLEDVIERTRAAGPLVDRGRGRVPPARHLRLPGRADGRDRAGGRSRHRRVRLRGADGGAARPRTRRGAQERRRRPRAARRLRPRGRLHERVRRLPRARRRDGRRRRRGARRRRSRSSSCTPRPSTPRAAGRSPTTACSSGREDAPRSRACTASTTTRC